MPHDVIRNFCQVMMYTFVLFIMYTSHLKDDRGIWSAVKEKKRNILTSPLRTL